MARSKASKQHVLERLQKSIGKSASVLFTSFQGLTVKETEKIRSACRAQNLECIMAKKTLFARAFQEHGITEVDFKKLEGELVATFSSDDEIAPSKVLSGFKKEFERLSILGGFMLHAPQGSRFIDPSVVAHLAKLPSRDELRAQLVGALVQPMRGMVGVLHGNLAGLVRVLHARAHSMSS